MLIEYSDLIGSNLDVGIDINYHLKRQLEENKVMFKSLRGYAVWDS